MINMSSLLISGQFFEVYPLMLEQNWRFSVHFILKMAIDYL